MKRLVYIIGEPGVGKSTVCRALFGHGTRSRWEADPRLVLVRRVDRWTHVGAVRRVHSGISSLPREPELILRWMTLTEPPGVICDGNLGRAHYPLAILDGAYRLGYQVDVVHLFAPREIVAARRSGRRRSETAKDRYSQPDPNQRWVTAALDTISRIREDCRWHVHTIDATQGPDQVAAEVMEILTTKEIS